MHRKVVEVIKSVFIHLPESKIEPLANVMVSCCGAEEALRLAKQVPQKPWGSFRFDVKTKSWIQLYSTWDAVDH